MTTIEIKNLSKKIQKNVILQDVSITMHAGNIYGLQGINGAGKTMLMRAILGLIRPSGGNIIINGKTLGKDMEFPNSVGFLLETPAFLDRYSGFENLKMLASIQQNIGEEQIRDSIHTVGLDPYDKKKYRKYSLGMKQRLGIAAAIMEQSDIIMMDEPTNALDSDGINLVKSILLEQKKRGALVIISCHDFYILQEMSDEIFKMNMGQIVGHTKKQSVSEEEGGLQ